MGPLIIAIIVVAISLMYVLIRENSLRQQKRAAEEERQREAKEEKEKQTLFICSHMPAIESANRDFNQLIRYSTGYFAVSDLNKWLSTYSRIFRKIEQLEYKMLFLSETEMAAVSRYIDIIKNHSKYREKYNDEFIRYELAAMDGYFSNVEGRSLDKQQRTAIILNDDNGLIIAGAGSGKTTTIVGKVNYTLQRYKIKPEEILLISFTRDSVNSLKRRIVAEGVKAMTFHKFGIEVIAAAGKKKPTIFDESQFSNTIKRFFNELRGDEKYLSMVVTFFLEYLKEPRSPFDFEEQGEFIQYIKDKNFQTYKTVSIAQRETFRMEIVKSIEECRIANFLYFNNVSYKYECPYEHDTATPMYSRWKPDFTIMQNGITLYYEHFAVDKNGNVPPFFASEGISYEEAKANYWAKIKWARDTSKRYKTQLIETYSYEMSENTLFDNLTRRLWECGIVLKPKSNEEIWEIINSVAEKETNNFLQLVETFITLLKSNNLTIPALRKKLKEDGGSLDKERTEMFLDIVEPIFNKYQNLLVEREEIDFSDMINQASRLISSGEYHKTIKYIIIDEFQDISVGRYRLVKSVKDANPGCKLFCVGDDWQSIYRFSGSDISLFKEFEKYFGHTVKSKIETTYRFGNPLIKMSTEFILRNPNQMFKNIKGVGDKETSYKILYSNEFDDDTEILVQLLDRLITEDDYVETKSIFLLGRYNFDINRIKPKSSHLIIDKANSVIIYQHGDDNTVLKKLKLKFHTVHSAKGLEADIVILINCNSGRYGFPSQLSDDSVLSLLLSKADQFENGEERRLFYVAMTRTREKLFLIANNVYKSKFVSELESSWVDAPAKCPRCKSADLVFRTGKNSKFYGCSNYAYGCDYKEWIND